MKTDRLRYILLSVGAVVGVIFLGTHLIPSSTPPVIVTGTLPPVPEAAPAQIGPAPTPSRKRRAKQSPDTVIPPSQNDDGKITIDVEGAVKHPHVYQLASGARIIQALSAAGGITADADVSSVNQAAQLADGDQVNVLTREQTAAHPRKKASRARAGRRKKAGSASSEKPQKILSGTININTASLEQLERIPGVGPKTAGDIIDYRRTHGNFRNSDDLMEMDGMSPGKYDKMSRFVTIY